MVYPCEHFNCHEDYQKSIKNLKKEDFFSKLKIKNSDNKEMERTKEETKFFNIKNGEELTKIFLKSHVILLTCVFQNYIKVSIIEFDINLLYSFSLHGYTWQFVLK